MGKHIDCIWVKQNLPHYIANELGVADSIKIGDHLLECHDCKRLYTELQEVTSLLGKIPPKLPQSLKEEIMEGVKVAKTKSFFAPLLKGTGYLYRFAVVALLFFLLGAGTSWFYLSRKKLTYNWKEVEGPVLVDSSVTKFSTAESRFIPDLKRM